MIVTIDTNILVQALSSNNGSSYQILEFILERKIDLAISIPVFCEYEDVLNRPSIINKLDISKTDLEDVLTFILLRAKRQKIFYLLRPNLKDEKDNIFVELAFSSHSKYLITNNIKDFKVNNELIMDSFKIMTPREFLKEWRKK